MTASWSACGIPLTCESTSPDSIRYGHYVYGPLGPFSSCICGNDDDADDDDDDCDDDDDDGGDVHTCSLVDIRLRVSGA